MDVVENAVYSFNQNMTVNSSETIFCVKKFKSFKSITSRNTKDNKTCIEYPLQKPEDWLVSGYQVKNKSHKRLLI